MVTGRATTAGAPPACGKHSTRALSWVEPWWNHDHPKRRIQEGRPDRARVSYGPHGTHRRGQAQHQAPGLTCRSCGGDVPDGARFCPNCGRRLPPESAGREERKLATVLFADLADSTELAMRVDAEHLRA